MNWSSPQVIGGLVAVAVVTLSLIALCYCLIRRMIWKQGTSESKDDQNIALESLRNNQLLKQMDPNNTQGISQYAMRQKQSSREA